MFLQEHRKQETAPWDSELGGPPDKKTTRPVMRSATGEAEASEPMTEDTAASVFGHYGDAGAPLDEQQRARFEPQLGADLSEVRIHQGGDAPRNLQARAFTLGSDVHFGPGNYAPGTAEGDRLLAHELTHVVQGGRSLQRKGEGPGGVSQPHEPAEQEADAVADDVTGALHGGTSRRGRRPISTELDGVGRKAYRKAEPQMPPPGEATFHNPRRGEPVEASWRPPAMPEKPAATAPLEGESPEETAVRSGLEAELPRLEEMIGANLRDRGAAARLLFANGTALRYAHKFPQNPRFQELHQRAQAKIDLVRSVSRQEIAGVKQEVALMRAGEPDLGKLSKLLEALYIWKGHPIWGTSLFAPEQKDVVECEQVIKEKLASINRMAKELDPNDPDLLRKLLRATVSTELAKIVAWNRTLKLAADFAGNYVGDKIDGAFGNQVGNWMADAASWWIDKRHDAQIDKLRALVADAEAVPDSELPELIAWVQEVKVRAAADFTHARQMNEATTGTPIPEAPADMPANVEEATEQTRGELGENADDLGQFFGNVENASTKGSLLTGTGDVFNPVFTWAGHLSRISQGFGVVDSLVQIGKAKQELAGLEGDLALRRYVDDIKKGDEDHPWPAF